MIHCYRYDWYSANRKQNKTKNTTSAIVVMNVKSMELEVLVRFIFLFVINYNPMESLHSIMGETARVLVTRNR